MAKKILATDQCSNEELPLVILLPSEIAAGNEKPRRSGVYESVAERS